MRKINRGSRWVLTAVLVSSPFILGTSNSGCTDKRAREMTFQQPAVKLEHSVERDNINKRLQLANDPTQIMWIYGLSDMGNVVFSSPVVGKVTSSTKRLEPRTMGGNNSITGYIGDDSYQTNEIMSADGTYGESDPYVFWFTPEQQYFQWNGKYILSNAPLRLERPILNMRDIDNEELARAQLASQALKQGKLVNNNLEVLK